MRHARWSAHFLLVGLRHEPRGRIVAKATGGPVQIGHIEVRTGDFVVADRSGVAAVGDVLGGVYEHLLNSKKDEP